MALLYSRQKKPCSAVRRTVRPALELLEKRLVLSPATPPTITLDPANDEFGAQVQTVTQFGNSNRVTFAIFDTGASPITIAPADQAGFASPHGAPDPIPIKVPGGASGDGIGGSVKGDVSVPITVLTDGVHAASVDFNPDTFAMTVTANFTPESIRASGIQAFIGTDSGSPNLPTISGTPVFAGGFNSSSRSKLAAKVDLINGVDLYGVGLLEPDVHFVSANTRLVPGANELLATIPLARIGASTVAKPGNDISSSYNFVSNTVALNNTASSQTYSLAGQAFLLDSGSQLTVISTAEAKSLHIDLSKPIDSVQVQGVGGVQTINGYVIDSLQIGLAGVGPLTVKNVPVFVLDAAPGQLDGILGMNLWNNVDQMLINPFTPFGATSIPTLTITWDPSYNGASHTGVFGFKLDQLLSGHQRPSTLDRLLGGAAQYFRVPVPISIHHASSPPPASAPHAGGNLLTQVPVMPDQEAMVISIINPLPATAPGLTENTSVTPARANPKTARIAATLSHADRAALEGSQVKGYIPVGNFADSAVHNSHSRRAAADVRRDYPAVTSIEALDQEASLPASPLVGASNEDTVLAMAPVVRFAEAALLAALALVIRDYWLPETEEHHFRQRIEATRLPRFGGV